jgi:membrane-associated protein
MALLHQLAHYLDVHFLLQTFGYPGIFFIIFAETGLMFGFFLPGDSLLITAGILAAKGFFDLTLLCLLLFAAASLGNIVGYYFGKHVGKRLFHREDSVLFHKKNIEAASKFYKDHGGKAIILARFIPIIRTFAPIVAGIGDMEIKTFLFFNIIGSLLWAVGLTVAGYFVGTLIPDKYFEPIVLLVILVSLSPAFYHAINTKTKRERLMHSLQRLFTKGK